MALLDRLRRRPRWEDPDPKVRADGVREIPSAEQDRLVQIAREDPDAHVRRAAVRRLSTVDALARIAAEDEDTGVREKAAETLVGLATGADEATASAAAAALSEPRHLLTVALSAAVAAVRADAVGRLRDPRALARIARTAGDPALRLQAVAGVAEPSALLEIASRSEHKDAAVAAVERIEDTGALRSVAGGARNKAAARRARERMGTLAPVERAAPAVDADEGAVAAEREGAEEVSVATDAAAERSPAAQDGAVDESVVEHRSGTMAAEEPSAPEGGGADEPESATAGAETTAPVAAEAHAADVPAAHDAPFADETPPADAHVESPGTADAHGGAAETPAAPPGPRLRPDRKERLAQAEALCARLTAIADAKPFVLRDADVALREARLPHDDVAGLPPKLARRLKETRAALFARAQEAREAEEWRRWGNATVQEELCRRVEALAAREDFEQVARDLRSLDDRWAEVRTAPRDEAEILRQKYQTARAPIKEKVDAYFTAKAAREAENLRLKQELAGRAEALADSTDWLKASDELKKLQARWKEIGPAPRRQADAVWKRFRAGCDRFFARRQEDLKKRKHEWAANMTRKQELCARAEALAESSDWEAAAAEVRRLQAEWKTVGPVRRDRSEAVWQRFRKACDAFFDRYKHRDELERLKRVAEREAVAAELEALSATAGEGSAAPANLAEEIQRLLGRARQGPPLPAADEETLAARLTAARDRAVSAWPEAFRGTDLDPEAGRARREKLCARVEALVSTGEAPAATLSGAELARRLKEALATNTIGGRVEAEAKRRAEADEVKAAQAAWRRLAPLPGEEGRAFDHRFRSACDRFFRQRPSPSPGESRAR